MLRDTMAFVSDSKEMCLLWRSCKSGVKSAYFRKRIGGRDKWQALGELPIEDARALVRKLRQAAAIGDIERRLGFASQKEGVSSFRELFAAYDAYSAGVDIDPNTVKNNKNSVGLILRRVLGDGFDVEGARVSVFSAQLLRDFAARSIARRKVACAELPVEVARERLESAQRTIKSTVQQARSLFARAALQSSAYARLSLPDLREVMELIVGASTVKAYEPPAAGVVERIARDAVGLRESNRGMWLALMLEVNGGLRRGSAVLARWDWFTVVEADGKGVPVAVDLRVGVAKGGRSVLRFDAGLYRDMVAFKGDGGGEVFVLPGESEVERLGVCAGLVAWLKERGLDRRQPNHELRKLYGDRKYSEHGAEEAQRALGHSDAKLTSRVYAAARAKRALRVM